MSTQCAAADMITVPGAITSPFEYFCFIESESFPVGMLIPKSMAKSEHALTASYKRASSPSFLHGHIQFADNETLCSPSFSGAQIILDNDSATALRLPAAALISADRGAWPTDVATPSFPW